MHIAGYREPWAQRADESETSYLAFLIWLHAEPRPIPTAQRQALEFDWATRARAFDAAHSFDADPLIEGKENVKRIFAIETRKLLRETQGGVSRSLTAREVIELARVALELGSSTTANYEGDLSSEQLDLIEAWLTGRRSA